jgi:hypothetical protein
VGHVLGVKSTTSKRSCRRNDGAIQPAPDAQLPGDAQVPGGVQAPEDKNSTPNTQTAQADIDSGNLSWMLRSQLHQLYTLPKQVAFE